MSRPDDQFWMVTRKAEHPGGGPKLRHKRYDHARREAQRLADMTGEPFIVLWSVNEVAPATEARP